MAMTRRPRIVFLVGVIAATMAFPGVARAQQPISVTIAKHARLTADGGVIFSVRVSCGPLAGTEDFREGSAGAGQPRTGAEAEGGLSPDIVCDGFERVYTADLSTFTDAVFARGPAHANVAVIACNTVGDQQVCVAASAQRRIIISGALVP
jgi:hypothetical protein